MSLNHLFTSQPSVASGLVRERRFDSKVIVTQAGSESHQDPLPQSCVFFGFFFLGGALTHFVLSTSPAPWKGIWQHHTFVLYHQDWLNQWVVVFPPPKKSHVDHLKPKAALWENPGGLKVLQDWSWGKQHLSTLAWMWQWVPVMEPRASSSSAHEPVVPSWGWGAGGGEWVVLGRCMWKWWCWQSSPTEPLSLWCPQYQINDCFMGEAGGLCK